MILPIVKYGDPVLAAIATEVTEFDRELSKLAEDMFETMYAAPGVGLAAPQIGVSKRLFVMDCTSGKDPSRKFAIANPVVEETTGQQDGDEGCLSVPGFFFPIKRASHVVVRGFNMKGEPIMIEGEGLEARCLLHETNHLDGKIVLNHLSPLKRSLTERKIQKKIKSGEWS